MPAPTASQIDCCPRRRRQGLAPRGRGVWRETMAAVRSTVVPPNCASPTAALLAILLLAAALPSAAIAALAAVAAPSTAPSAVATTPAPTPASTPLLLESIEITGNSRTPDSTVLLFLPLRAGEAVDQERLVAAVEELRASELFASVEFHARPGSERGRLVLALAVVERPVELRLGTGNTDLDGWYLIPAELALDNRMGRGERLAAQLRLGYRTAGAVLAFAEPRAGDGCTFWGAELAALGTQRLYFADGVEYRHQVDRQRFGVHAGRRFSRRLSGAIGWRLETVEADSSAEVNADDDARGLERGDDLPFAQLPAGVAAGVGRHERSFVTAGLVLDSRSQRQVAGSPVAGAWSRLRLEQCLQGDRGFGAADLDLRAYRAALGGVVAARWRGSVVGDAAPFYDRLYLGGLYTVRGFPGQSLSAPAGDTWLWAGSLEYRAPLVGDCARPRLAGVLFLDAGQSGGGETGGGDASDGDGGEAVKAAWSGRRDIAAAAGWGVRLRVGWLGWLGLDCGVPLTDSPVDDAFRAHASIGWTF